MAEGNAFKNYFAERIVQLRSCAAAMDLEEDRRSAGQPGRSLAPKPSRKTQLHPRRNRTRRGKVQRAPRYQVVQDQDLSSNFDYSEGEHDPDSEEDPDEKADKWKKFYENKSHLEAARAAKKAAAAPAEPAAALPRTSTPPPAAQSAQPTPPDQPSSPSPVRTRAALHKKRTTLADHPLNAHVEDEFLINEDEFPPINTESIPPVGSTPHPISATS